MVIPGGPCPSLWRQEGANGEQGILEAESREAFSSALKSLVQPSTARLAAGGWLP